jgi:hypothetical protein
MKTGCFGQSFSLFEPDEDTQKAALFTLIPASVLRKYCFGRNFWAVYLICTTGAAGRYIFVSSQ